MRRCIGDYINFVRPEHHIDQPLFYHDEKPLRRLLLSSSQPYLWNTSNATFLKANKTMKKQISSINVVVKLLSISLLLAFTITPIPPIYEFFETNYNTTARVLVYRCQ